MKQLHISGCSLSFPEIIFVFYPLIPSFLSQDYIEILEIYIEISEIYQMVWYTRASLVAQMVKNLPTMQEIQVQSLGWEDPWRREWQPTPVSLVENPMDRRAWWATVWGHKELDMIEQLTQT